MNKIDLKDLTEHELQILMQDTKKALEEYKKQKNQKVYFLSIPFRDNLMFIKLETLLKTLKEFLDESDDKCWLINEEFLNAKTEMGVKYVNRRDLIYCIDYDDN